MKILSFFIPCNKSSGIIALFILCVFSVCPAMSQSNEEPGATPEGLIRLIEPQNDATVIGKKPLIRIHMNELNSYGNIIVILDGSDITNVIEIDGDELHYTPIEVMAAGVHNLEVVAYSSEGNEVRQNFTFNTRHSESFDEAYSNNVADGTYRYLLARCKHLDNVNLNRYRADLNLSTESKLKQGNFDTTLTGNLRYLNQQLPLEPPEEDFISLTHVLWATNYLYNDYRFGSEMGDVQINESPNTLEGLARRGAKISTGYTNYDLNAFAVKSKELYGFNGGIGIGGSRDEHILGVSGGAKYFSDALEIKIIHIEGGQEGLTYGMWEEQETFQKGHVSGIVLKSSLLQNLLQLETEYNASTYEDYTLDDYTFEQPPVERDRAFRARADANYRQYTLGGGYEYFGPDYHVIGNPNIQSDREGYNMQSGASFEISSVNLSYAQYWDNVEEEPLYARITYREFLLDYSYTQIQNFLLNATYQKITEESSMEPDIDYRVRNYTDIYSGSANYAISLWNFGFQTIHSFQDDRTIANYDTITRSYGFSPSFASEYLSVGPSFNYDTTRDRNAHITTDSYTASYSIIANIILNKLIFETGGSYNKTTTSDRLTDTRTFSADYKLSYVFQELLGFRDTAFSIEGVFMRTKDQITRQRGHEHSIYFVVSSTLPFSF